jgi:hypothetical protein
VKKLSSKKIAFYFLTNVIWTPLNIVVKKYYDLQVIVSAIILSLIYVQNLTLELIKSLE